MRLMYGQITQNLNSLQNANEICTAIEHSAVDSWRLKYGNNHSSSLKSIQDIIEKYYPSTS